MTNVEVLKEYAQITIDYPEGLETKTWTKELADFFSLPLGIEKVIIES